MVSILRAPDYAFGATEGAAYRFEEPKTAACEVEYKYEVLKNSAKITVYPSGSPVKYLKLRFEGDMSEVVSVLGDQWERNGEGAYIEWRSVMANRALPWFCYVKLKDRFVSYGIKTGADCFGFWNVDKRGVTLFLNLMSASQGVDLKEPLVACEVTELVGNIGEGAYSVAKRFAKMLCERPVLPKEPIFGVNNWYWAYGKISHDSVMKETDHLLKMTEGTRHRPYMILDDGWQLNRTYDTGAYIGGPWLANDRFGDMRRTADAIHEKGAKAGIWFRPLLTLGDVTEEAKLTKFSAGGVILDPTHPYTLERVERDAREIRSWGYELLKHDFSTVDIIGDSPFSSEKHTANVCKSDRKFFDTTVTTATAIKRLYEVIQKGAGDADVIGCNAVGHLMAGIHSVYRTGNDTSGRSFEWSHRNGINTMMRLPLNDSFYRADPDCAAFTERVDADVNLDFLEMCAITGVTTLASVTPDILTRDQMKRINEIYRIADNDEYRYEIGDFETNANPEVFVDPKTGKTREFDWERIYHGSRHVLDWFN
jgi:alpha-galactosidase